jgi:hypothetical protein
MVADGACAVRRGRACTASDLAACGQVDPIGFFKASGPGLTYRLANGADRRYTLR